MNPARKVFVAALSLFLLWVAALTTLAVVASYRPDSGIRRSTDLTD